MLNQNDSESFDTHNTCANEIKNKILKEGTGSKQKPLTTATVHYTVWLLDKNNIVGEKFDSSKDRGQHFKFTLGQCQVIKGWDISVADMKTGETRLVVIPSNLAYGARGKGQNIPPHATFLFEIELILV